jgi:hypothetical protein
MIKNNPYKRVWHQFINTPPRNLPQQMRFLRSPKANLGSDFEASQQDFSKQIKDINKPMKTFFSDYWEEF